MYMKNFVILLIAQGTLPNVGDLVIKRINTEAGLAELKNEVKILARLNHPNIIRMMGSCIGNNVDLICYEYMPGGSLDAVLFGMFFLQYKWFLADIIFIISIRCILMAILPALN